MNFFSWTENCVKQKRSEIISCCFSDKRVIIVLNFITAPGELHFTKGRLFFKGGGII